MQHSLLRLEMLKEGRSIRLPITLIFYNSILAFMTILFIFFNNESQQVGYYSGHSSFRFQFLIISSFQILTVFVLMPFSVSSMEETDRAVTEQFLMIPGVIRHHILAKIHLLVAINLLIFVSSLPIISVSFIYSGISLVKLFRLIGIITLCSIWSGSLSLFFYSICKRPLFAFAGTVFSYFMFTIGILMILEVCKGVATALSQTGQIGNGMRYLCLLLNLFNPLAVYVAYYANFAGNVPMVSTYFSNFGIDVNNVSFSFLYYKAATICCILSSLLFLYYAISYFNREERI